MRQCGGSVEKPRSRRWMGCLVGCLIALGAVILFVLIIVYLMFRTHPPLAEETFFTAEVSGFARIQLDALRSQPMRELMRNVVKETDKTGAPSGEKETDPEAVLSSLGFLLHERHFLYIYAGMGESRLRAMDSATGRGNYLFVANIKRFSWVIPLMLGGDKNRAVKEIPPPPGVRAHCYVMKFPERKTEKEKSLTRHIFSDGARAEPIYLAVVPRAIFISNSEERLKDALLFTHPPQADTTSPHGLSPLGNYLLPPSATDDMVSGFGLWQKQWNENILKKFQETYPKSGDVTAVLGDVLSRSHFQGVRFRCRLISSDVLQIDLKILCSSEDEAAMVADSLKNNLKPLISTAEWEVQFVANGKMLNIDIQRRGIEKWVIGKVKKP
ncbi:MAG: hypothetical protein NT106_03950 [Candidatus Sumerlaeota bacterium]|nr:hypothetical protein [Candidatus Sumerlaeota bacterium]